MNDALRLKMLSMFVQLTSVEDAVDNVIKELTVFKETGCKEDDYPMATVYILMMKMSKVLDNPEEMAQKFENFEEFEKISKDLKKGV